MTRLSDNFHLAASRNHGRGAVVGHDDIVLVAVLDAPLATNQDGFVTFLAANGGTPCPFHCTCPTIVSRFVAAIAATFAFALSTSADRLRTSLATSNSEWMKPIGCVHCFFVAAVNSSASCFDGHAVKR